MFVGKPLVYSELKGLSAKQLSSHHDVLYLGYVKKMNEIEDKLANLERGSGNSTHSEYRELKIESSLAQNGIILHELYFENLGGDGQPSDEMILRLKGSFPSFQDFQSELIDAGLSARGWVVLGLDNDGRMRIHLCDAHNMNGIWGSIPLLVLDVYEHAYFIDYATNRKAYLEAFMKIVNWRVVESRLFDLALPA